jgi:hypothetical protein
MLHMILLMGIVGKSWRNPCSRSTFFLRFDSSYSLKLQSLDSFRSSFWLEEKRWYVAYQSGCLFSVPQFTLPENENPYQLPVYSTLPDITNIYNHVTKIFLGAPPVNNKIYFNNMKILVYRCSISFDVLSSILDPHQFEQLIVWSINDVLKFIRLKCTMLHLNNLTIAQSSNWKQWANNKLSMQTDL